MATTMFNPIRVVCLSHALTPKDISTVSIEARRKEQRRSWYQPGDQQVDTIDWLRFPFIPPPAVGARPVDVHFKIMAVMGAEFIRELKSGLAYSWVEQAVLEIVQEAKNAGLEHVFIGLGAYTKTATHHGVDLLARLPERIAKYVTFVHGDPGTVQLVIEMIKDAGFPPGFAAAIVGANGAIGEPLARILPQFTPGKIVLIGKADKPGENKNRLRLEGLSNEVKLLNGEVVISQDEFACSEHSCGLVIVATNDHHFPPDAVVPGTLVLDIAAPNACWPDDNDGWRGKWVLLAGCGQFTEQSLPEGFGIYNDKMLKQVIGGEREFWGCMMHAVTQGAFDYRHHVVGHAIKDDDIAWVAEHFAKLGCRAQEPNMFHKPLTRVAVKVFVGVAGPLPVRGVEATGT